MTALFLCVAVAVSKPSVASAQRPLGYSVDARVHTESGVVEGTVETNVRVPQKARGVRLWLYADRLAVAPSAMDEISARWIFPGEVHLGGITVTNVRVDGATVHPSVKRAPVGTRRGRDFAGADLWVPSGASGRVVTIRLRFRVRLPERFGRLGRVGDRLTLAAPWYPLVVGPDDAFDYRVPHEVHVALAGPGEGLLGDHLFRGEAEVRTNGPYVPLFVAPHLHVVTRLVRGVTLRYVSEKAPYQPPPPSAHGLDALRDLVRIDVVGRVAQQLADVVDTMKALQLPIPSRAVTVVQVPFRTELTGTAPGWVAVSDRLYEIFPVDAARAFHDRAVRWALFRRLMQGEPLADPPADRPFGEDLRAALLVDLDMARRHRKAKTPQQILGWAGFHPLVDQLLYAPQVQFKDVYFGAVDDTNPFRDAPSLARRPRSTGRRVLEMARNALDHAQMRAFAKELLALHVPVRKALAEAAPKQAAHLSVWLDAPELPVNYRIGEIRNARVPSGYLHRIEVIRQGAHRPEPVEVLVEDAQGHRVTVRWAGEKDRGTVEAITPAPLREVTLDPHHRLVESPEVAHGHPRADDSTRNPWRPPILQGVYLAATPSERKVEGFIDFVMRRRYDIDRGLGVRLETDPRSTGGLLRYIRGFGRAVTTNQRSAFVSQGVEVRRLHERFTTGAQGGWRTGLLLSAGVDTHKYYVDPRTGQSLTGSFRLGIVRRDDGKVLPTWAAGLRGNVTWPVGLLNAFVLVAGASYAGGEALPSELPGLGGQTVLRGYESNELVGRGVVYGVLEHRWTVVRDMAWNLLHLAWLRELQLALFVGGGAVFDTLQGQRVAYGAEVGGGIRFHFDYGGVQPGVIALDLGVPLIRTAQQRAARPPVTFHLAFDQYF